MFVEILIFIITTLIAYYLYVYKRVHYLFDKNGVKYLSGVPIFGNILKSTFLKSHMFEDIDAVYKAFPGEKYVGYIEGTTPIILIRDPDIIKTVTVKEFDHFVNHNQFFGEDIEPLFGGSLLLMKDDKWRDMRTTLSPAFTGSKLRLMLPFMIDISVNIVEYLNGHELEDIDVDELMRRYTNDVIASAGYGIQVNSLKDKNNQFYTTGQSLFQFNILQRVKFFLVIQFPRLAKALHIKIFPDSTTNFFRNIVHGTMKYRKENNVERPDMIQLLMEASKGTLKHTEGNEDKDVGFAVVNEVLDHKKPIRKWTDDELTSQVFIFFVAGFESSATMLVMCIHELALNPHVQDKLYHEIMEFKEANIDITYENIGKLKYLDCVLNETSRKWSAAIMLDRVCTKDFELPPPREGGKPYRVNKGDLVYNSVNSLHMDPKYFPDPEKFDPERFSDENKHNIKPFTFVPFGAGPRNCIGSRFALLELKVLMFNLILYFKIVRTDKTSDPIKLAPKDFNIKALGGTWVRFQRRNEIF